LLWYFEVRTAVVSRQDYSSMKYFCSLKAFGDMVVTCRFLRRVPRGEYSVLALPHLKSIYEAIGAPLDVTWLPVGDSKTVPAAFDSRRLGAKAAFFSLLSLRSGIRQNVKRGDLLVFDRLEGRERFLAFPGSATDIQHPGTSGIYENYSRFFGAEWLAPLASVPPGPVVLFPNAREQHRVLPDELLLEIARQCRLRNLPVSCVRVGKRDPTPENRELPVTWIDGFDALVSSIRSATLVVSSDSLPAHVAEYFGIPVFVFNPRKKDYFMPASCLQHGGFGLFAEAVLFASWLDRIVTVQV
jgi:hypothetical protein